MNALCRFALVWILASGATQANPAAADRIKASLKADMEAWSQSVRAATTPEARTKAWESRPDPASYGRKMWTLLAPSLNEPWSLDPAAWFVGLTANLRSTQPDGNSPLTFASELNTLRETIEAKHMASPGLAPLCLALSTSEEPKSLTLLEKIQAQHADKKVQGVAALAIAMRLKTLGDDPAVMSKRISLLRKAIIESADSELNGTTVAKIAQDELYIIVNLAKGRVAPDLSGTDSGLRPMKLSDHKGKVIVLLFWNSSIENANAILQMATSLEKNFSGKPFVVIGVNNDPVETLREMQKQPDLVTFPNFSDPQNRLANDYRIGSWPLAYVLDAERKVAYAGPPSSFVGLTAAALLDPPKATPGK